MLLKNQVSLVDIATHIQKESSSDQLSILRTRLHEVICARINQSTRLIPPISTTHLDLMRSLLLHDLDDNEVELPIQESDNIWVSLNVKTKTRMNLIFSWANQLYPGELHTWTKQQVCTLYSRINKRSMFVMLHARLVSDGFVRLSGTCKIKMFNCRPQARLILHTANVDHVNLEGLVERSRMPRRSRATS